MENRLSKYISDKYEIKTDGNIFTYNVPINEIVEVCRELYVDYKFQLKIITASAEGKNEFKIHYIFGLPKENIFLIPYIKVTKDFPTLTEYIHEASGYERRIKSFFGLNPIGHLLPRQILLHENWPENLHPLKKDFNWQKRPKEAHGKYEFQKVEGEGIYEIPVGPVHAGIIEPGHFRFSMVGEEIILLEPKLGYKHKGIEKLFEVKSLEENVKLSERVSGDTSFTHSMAFCQAIENIADIEIPARAQYLRVIFSELERLANHFNDIGFIMLDTGYNFGGSNCARLREMLMQIHENLCGSRFLRGINSIGGVNIDITQEKLSQLLAHLRKIYKDFKEVIKISENSSTLLRRLAGTGKLENQLAVDHGALGVSGRAIGIEHDARLEYPYAAYDKIEFNIALENEGDVQARWALRIKEVHSSKLILEKAIEGIPISKELKKSKKIILKPNSFGIGITEAWRGEVIYFVITDSNGKIIRVDVRDPSFLNWPLVGHAGKGNVLPDFPLINKSFNLSYSGNDL